MNLHFNNFTPEAMRAFGQELADGLQRRVEFIHHTRNETFAALADSRKEHTSAEAKRRERASREADARRLFMSELKSGVHSLLGRFELSRKEMAEDFQGMARELHSACDAFQNRHGRQGGPFRGERAGQPPKQSPKPQRPTASAQSYRPTPDTHDSAKASGTPQPFRPAADSHDSPKASGSAQPSRPAADSHDSPKARSGPEDKPGDSKKHQG
jgi:hypothetical protein